MACKKANDVGIYSLNHRIRIETIASPACVLALKEVSVFFRSLLLVQHTPSIVNTDLSAAKK